MDQVRTYQPPENFAKETDSRYAQYEAEFGATCWELDALNPQVLAQLVTGAVQELRDQDLWQAAVTRENEARAELQEYAAEYRDRE